MGADCPGMEDINTFSLRYSFALRACDSLGRQDVRNEVRRCLCAGSQSFALAFDGWLYVLMML
jgi:hypothetical protein